jgi:hypothetical protein
MNDEEALMGKRLVLDGRQGKGEGKRLQTSQDWLLKSEVEGDAQDFPATF